jgi:hypothetical protein
MARWRPEKWAVRIGDSDSYLIGGRPAGWQWIKRRRLKRLKYPFGAEPFDWRSVRIGFRRPDDHWRNDDPPVRPPNRLLHRRTTKAQRQRYDVYMTKIAAATSVEERERLTRELDAWLADINA